MISYQFKFTGVLLALYLLALSSSAQQSIADYIGKWQGEIANKNDFDLDITIKKGEHGKAIFIISNSKMMIRKEFYLEKNIKLTLDDNIVFRGTIDKQNLEIDGLIQSHAYFYPATLKREGNDYKGKWKLSAFQYLQAESLILNIKKGNGPADEYPAYPILGTQWCNNFKHHKDTISFTDNFTGLIFKGVLKTSEIILDVSLSKKVISKISYKRAKDNVNESKTRYLKLDDGWKLSDKPLTLLKLEEDILNDTLDGTESVLVAKNGKIIYENYFDGFYATTPHDMRSASKSISSAIIGIAIDNGIIESVDEAIYKFIPEKYKYTTDSSKFKIKLKDLLTMSSGIGVYEDDYQESDNWLKTVLEPSLKHEPGKVTNYNSSDPYLAGIYLNERLSIPMESFIVDKLFSPLGISNYIMNTDDSGLPYFGGGLYLTPRDMLKFGQLYLNKGTWNEKRIISENWVNDSFIKHTQLDEASGGNEYGYLWWHNTYEIDGRKIMSIEARGAGGQFIFIIPELDAVVVITSGNYRVRKNRQCEKILKEYILKSIL